MVAKALSSETITLIRLSYDCYVSPLSIRIKAVAYLVLHQFLLGTSSGHLDLLRADEQHVLQLPKLCHDPETMTWNFRRALLKTTPILLTY